MKRNSDHPEILDMEHICRILPKTKDTEAICEKFNQDKSLSSHIKKARRKK